MGKPIVKGGQQFCSPECVEAYDAGEDDDEEDDDVDDDLEDDDETVVVTEFFAQRTAPEAADLSNVDTNWVGVLYLVDPATEEVSTGLLGPRETGVQCFPNQLQGVTIQGASAYVTSICASPWGACRKHGRSRVLPGRSSTRRST